MLEQYNEQAKQAFYWTSFNPDKRGQRVIDDYTQQLTQDIKELTDSGVEQETIHSYKARYIALFRSWLSAQSRCASSVITGGSGFNVRRAEKANRSEERHYELWQEWRSRAKKAIVRKSQPIKTYVSELERYKTELEQMKKNHELMKEGNKRIKQGGADLDKYLTDTFGIEPHMLQWTKNFGFGLANNNANMKRVEQRIKELEAKEAQRTTGEEKSWQYSWGKVLYNYEADRIQLLTNEKNSEQIALFKRHGFKWAPSQKAWQRQLTVNGKYSTKLLIEKLSTL
jgi:hypothetical protein